MRGSAASGVPCEERRQSTAPVGGALYVRAFRSAPRSSAPAVRATKMQLFEHPYSNFLQRVEKPTRYTGAEHGTRRKNWTAVDARVCLAFPDIYDIGMSHLGFRMLYKILNDHP